MHRHTMIGVAVWLVMAPVGTLGTGRPFPQVSAADVVLLNGKILTVDARDSIAQTVAIAGGKIVAVGSTPDVRGRIGPATQVIDLRGRTVTPGLIDTHVHFSEVDALFSVDLSDVSITRMDDVLKRVGEQAARLEAGEWVRGRGWDEGKLAERRYITAADLDKVAPNNPVWLTNTTGHYGVANSYALKMAEIRKSTNDPPAGTIDRDGQGNPTGVLKESAMGLVTRLVPPFTRDQQKQGLVAMIRDFNKEGMTAAKDPGIGQQKWDLYQELLKEGALTVRMFALWSGPRRVEDTAQVLARVEANPRPPASLGDGMLLSGGVKMYMDGSGGARTAWMHDDWNKNFTEKDAGNAGYPATPPDAYRQIVTELHNAGVHVSTHAIGDRAIDRVVDTYDRALAAEPTRGLRHGIIHDNTPTDHAIDVTARLHALRRCVPGVAGRVHVVDWRHLRRESRSGPRAPALAVAHVRRQRHQMGGRIGLQRDAVSRALWPVGVGGAHNAARDVRGDSVRAGRVGGHQGGSALVHDLGGASTVPGRPHRLD
jgi:predicted amidohydrolase YtcJ